MGAPAGIRMLILCPSAGLETVTGGLRQGESDNHSHNTDELGAVSSTFQGTMFELEEKNKIKLFPLQNLQKVTIICFPC